MNQQPESNNIASEHATAEEVRKSNLILEAQLLREQGQTDEAAAKFAEAARLEESLGRHYAAQGQFEKAHLHRYSAMSLWAQAGNFYQAIELGDELLASPDLLERLRQRVQFYTQTLRQRRARWREEVGLEIAA
jgi:tetratricopeptide (TPR) repeat protein